MTEEERKKAAEPIQRNYRGHRERRQMNGMTMDASSRWADALKEARYRHITKPRPRSSQENRRSGELDATGRPRIDVNKDGHGMTEEMPSEARQRWKKIGTIAKRAANDEDITTESSESEDEAGLSFEKRELKRKRKEERRKGGKTMDLNYWLEMVDVWHRYGSNLRTYHQAWQKEDNQENFFHWLDYGEGRTFEVTGCTRERLDKERVRYLSKEERKDYLVKIDKAGRLCWAKNGAKIDTTLDYKDSIHGIVPASSDVPAFNPHTHASSAEAAHVQEHSAIRFSSDSSRSRSGDEDSNDAATHYANQLDDAKGVKKVRHVTPATIFNKLLRSSVKKNTWIFVADTNSRLYVGIKQSGAFQHSSFLHGSRISAAGLIKVKDGQLDKLSPLSGHYRPPVASFRAFVHALKEAGVDMSHVSISRSYAVLVGLEAYVKTRRRAKRVVAKVTKGREKLLDPEEARRKEEAEKDTSESAAREREVLAEEEEREHNQANLKLMQKLKIRTRTPRHSEERARTSQEAVKLVDQNTVAEDAFGKDQNSVINEDPRDSDEAQGPHERVTMETGGVFRRLTHTRRRYSGENRLA